MVAEKHLKGLEEMAEHLNIGMSRMKGIVAECESPGTNLPDFPGKALGGRGPRRCTASELDGWWAEYREAKLRTPYSRRVRPRPAPAPQPPQAPAEE